jgi:group II intron reverse transcriptase/maturase/CRISPR-associated endonuclease Cas1
MTLPIHTLLPLYGLDVTLQFTEDTHLNFFHQLALSPFLRFLLNSPEHFDSLMRIDACEAGRLFYQAGDYYRFSVFGLNGSQSLLQQLISQLQNLPFSVKKDDKKMPFRRNLQLVALHDSYSQQAVEHIQQLTPYTFDDLQQESLIWQTMPCFKIQLLSPVRLLKDSQLRQQCKGEARYCQQKTDLTADLLSNRLHDYFSALLTKQGLTIPAREQPQALIVEEQTHLFWLNPHYTDSDGKAHAAGGMMGEVILTLPEPESFDWTLWVLGQYTGFGQRASFGWGRYRLQTLNDECTFERTFPACSLLTAVGAIENLISAFEHIQNNAQSATEKTELEMVDEQVLERLQSDIAKLLDNRFTPPPLQGFVIDNPDNSSRPLAVPPFRDRVLQRAVAQVLQPIVDELHYQHSYGYRTGRSRINASYAIQSAWREGYRWVYESDIADFFDSIIWQRLLVRLQELWGDDPLVAALLQWMQAPVEFEGQLIQRVQGLPQGSPLSPLLANIMLDDFDNDMQMAGFKLIRFADDFVVLCKSKEQAELAHQAAVASLQEHGLQLNQDKTHISRMADGFYYLGYLFVNDMVLESPKRLRPQAVDDSISKHSWLSQVVARPAKAINQAETTASPAPEITTASPQKDWQSCTTNVTEESKASTISAVNQYGERNEHGLLLCVTGESCIIRTEEERLQVERGEQTLYDVPWRHLHAVLLFGRHNITTPALTTAMEFNIPLHFASQTGHYQGVVWNGQAGAQGTQLWLKQQQVFSQPEQALAIAKEIVAARLFNMRETLRLRAKAQHSAQIDSLLEKLGGATTLAELNGFEGSGTRIYFTGLRELLPAEFNFNERNRQPPLDPFNSLLSLGYSVLYSCLETVLRSDGLLPWQGFYHQPHGKHATLASDLMEPFRHLVERLAMALIKRHELKLKDFYITEQNACYLQKQARNFYLSQLMANFESKTLFELIHQQNLSLIRLIEQGEAFKAWRVR